MHFVFVIENEYEKKKLWKKRILNFHNKISTFSSTIPS